MPQRVWIEPLTAATDPDFALPLREYNALGRAGVRTVEDVLALLRTPRDIEGLGERGWDRMTGALMSYLEHVGVRETYSARIVAAGASRRGEFAPCTLTPAPATTPTSTKETPMTNATITRTRWSEADEAALVQAGDSAGTGELTDVFERVAADRGVSMSTVRSKYYALKKGPGGSRKASRKGARWSRNLEGRLVREVRDAPRAERAGVFEAWGQRRGVSASAIKAKYYSVKSRYEKAAPAQQPAAPTAGQAATPGEAKPSEPTVTGAATDLSALTLAELASLGRCVNVEIERRVTAVQKLWA